MKLNRESLKNAAEWKSMGVALPSFDVEQMEKNTRANPIWIHFGAGNIFRGFIARLQQKLLNQGLSQNGIIAVDTFDYDIIDRIYAPYDNLTLMVGLKADGKTEKEIVGSVAEALKANTADEASISRLVELFCNPSLQMVSFTITEKGYAISDLNGQLFPVVKSDVENGPKQAKHAMSIVTALMYERYKAGAFPVALTSMDNCSHNGEKLRRSIFEIAKQWKERGFVTQEFVEYLSDETKVSFPWSMIDKITPRPAPQIEAELNAVGISDMKTIITSRNTYIAPFVNAEIPEYLVIEDRFPNGRPLLEKAGVYFTDRETVNKTERMKVTTCLNPLHTALAIFGCLLGYHRISDELNDPALKELIERIGYDEGMPVVTDPRIIKPQEFIHEVIDDRLPNPFIPDMPQRIATDTSQKVSIRFGETIKSYISSPNLDVRNLTYIPLVIAAWMRYLLALDDQCQSMEVSSDPMLSELQSMLAEIKVGKPETYKGQLKPILANVTLFGTDLCACGLADRIEKMFCEMLTGVGAVRYTLAKYLKQTNS